MKARSRTRIGLSSPLRGGGKEGGSMNEEITDERKKLIAKQRILPDGAPSGLGGAGDQVARVPRGFQQAQAHVESHRGGATGAVGRMGLVHPHHLPPEAHG